MLPSRKKNNVDERLQDYNMGDGFSWTVLESKTKSVATHPVFHFVSHQLQTLTPR